MAKVPVDEAPAGPALDAAVAEALVWLPYESDGVWYWKDMSDDDFPYWEHHAGGYDYVEDLKPWSPSADIAAAWELIGKFLYFSLFRYKSGLWRCQYRHCGNPTSHSVGHCSCDFGWSKNRASLAICRAFLEAQGVTHVEIPDD